MQVQSLLYQYLIVHCTNILQCNTNSYIKKTKINKNLKSFCLFEVIFQFQFNNDLRVLDNQNYRKLG